MATPHVTLCFFMKRGFLAWLVRLWTGSRFAHVEMEFPDGARLRLYPGMRAVLDTDLRQPVPDAVAGIPLTLDEEAQARAMAGMLAGSVYDWQGIIFDQLLPFGREDSERWFCSEACAWILIELGRLPRDRQPSWYSPGRLARLFHVE